MGDQIRIPRVVIYSFFSVFFPLPFFKAILKSPELPALCNVVSSTCIYQQFVPHFALSSLFVVCGITSERLALIAGFKAVLDDEGKSLEVSLSDSDTLPLVPSFIFTR